MLQYKQMWIYIDYELHCASHYWARSKQSVYVGWMNVQRFFWPEWQDETDNICCCLSFSCFRPFTGPTSAARHAGPESSNRSAPITAFDVQIHWNRDECPKMRACLFHLDRGFEKWWPPRKRQENTFAFCGKVGKHRRPWMDFFTGGFTQLIRCAMDLTLTAISHNIFSGNHVRLSYFMDSYWR